MWVVWSLEQGRIKKTEKGGRGSSDYKVIVPQRMLHLKSKWKPLGECYFKLNNYYWCFIFTTYLGQGLEEVRKSVWKYQSERRGSTWAVGKVSLEEVRSYLGMQKGKDFDQCLYNGNRGGLGLPGWGRKYLEQRTRALYTQTDGFRCIVKLFKIINIPIHWALDNYQALC